MYAAQYDQLDSGAAAEAFGIPRLRKKLIGAAHGDVLEVAVGQPVGSPVPCSALMRQVSWLALVCFGLRCGNPIMHGLNSDANGCLDGVLTVAGF